MKLKIKSKNPENPVLSILEAEATAREIREKAIAKAERRQYRDNQRIKARREARETEEANRETPEPTADQVNDILYFIGNYNNINPRVITPVLRVEEEEEAEEVTGTGTITKLTNKDFICLYYSNRLLIGRRNPREADPKDKLQEGEVLKYLRHLNPFVKMVDNGKATEPISNLYRIAYETDQANTPEAIRYLLSFKGEPTKATNTQTGQNGNRQAILSYNNIEYEPNEIIIIGKKASIQNIKNKFERLNNIKNSYYDFREEKEANQRIIREYKEKDLIIKEYRGKANPVHRERMLNNIRGNTAQGRYYEEAETAEKAEMINKCLYYSFKTFTPQGQLKTTVTGLNNIREDEKEVTKKLRENRNRSTAEIIQEIKETVRKVDGRQSIRNIEYDIKKDLKYLKLEKAGFLYWIKKTIEEETATEEVDNEEQRKQDITEDKEELKQDNEEMKAENDRKKYYKIARNKEEIKEINEELKRIAKAPKKKIKGLLYVLESYLQIAEDRERFKEELTAQLEEAQGKDNKNKFKAGKKRKNIYSNIYGIQRPNGNPQTTHRHRNNLKPLQIVKAEQEAEKQAKEQKARREARNKAPEFKEIVREAQAYIQYCKGYKGGRMIREASRRNKRKRELRELMKQEVKASYGSILDKATERDIKQLINESLKFYEFKTAYEIAIEEELKNMMKVVREFNNL